MLCPCSRVAALETHLSELTQRKAQAAAAAALFPHRYRNLNLHRGGLTIASPAAGAGPGGTHSTSAESAMPGMSLLSPPIKLPPPLNTT